MLVYQRVVLDLFRGPNFGVMWHTQFHKPLPSPYMDGFATFPQMVGFWHWVYQSTMLSVGYSISQINIITYTYTYTVYISICAYIYNYIYNYIYITIYIYAWYSYGFPTKSIILTASTTLFDIWGKNDLVHIKFPIRGRHNSKSVEVREYFLHSSQTR